MRGILNPMCEVFPRVASCTYWKFGGGGRQTGLDALCILALNIVIDKIYLVLWFWFVILGIFGSVRVGCRVFQIAFSDIRYFLMQMKMHRLAIISLRNTRASCCCSYCSYYKIGKLEKLKDLDFGANFSGVTSWNLNSFCSRLAAGPLCLICLFFIFVAYVTFCFIFIYPLRQNPEIRRYFRNSEHVQDVKSYIKSVSIGDWFVLYQMSKNLNRRFFHEFLIQLSKEAKLYGTTT